MGTFFIISGSLKLLSGLGLAYIIWVLSAKEDGNAKVVGMVISILIIVLALLSAVYGVHSFKRMHNESDKCIAGVSTMETSTMTTQEAKLMPKHSWKRHIRK